LTLQAADLVTAQAQPVRLSVPVSGTVEAVRTAVVKARVAGELQWLAVREGEAVRAGQVVARIDPVEFEARLRQAQQQVASAQAQAEIAQRTLQNNQALVAHGFISRNALETAASNLAAAEAAVQAAQAAADVARKALADTELRAPIGGWVAQRFVQPGERVGVDARVLEIVDLSALELRATLPPQQVAAVRVGAPARVQVEGLPAPLAARVVRINPSAQASTRAVPVYLALAAEPGLRHGLFATGEIELGVEQALAVPETAVRRDAARPYVLRLEGDRAVRRSVELGPVGEVDGTPMRIIRAGLDAGDQILAASVGLVPDGARVRLAARASGG
jgi:RND family efflux transporter MFP subunit